MISLELLADDVTPARPSASKGQKVRLTSPLRAPSGSLPRLELSPETPSAHTASPGPVETSALRLPTVHHGGDAELVAELTDALSTSHAQVAELQQQLLITEQQHSKLMAHHTVLTSTIREMNEAVVDEREKRHQLEHELSKERAASSRSVDRVGEMELENSRLRDTVEGLRRQLDADTKAKFGLDEQLCQTTFDLEHLRSDLSSTTAQLVDAQRAKARLEEDANRVAEKLAVAENRVAVALSQADMHRAAAEAAEHVAAKQTNELRKRMKQHSDTSKKLEEAKAELKASTAEIEKKFGQLTDIANDIERLATKLHANGSKGFAPGMNPKAQLNWIGSQFDMLHRSQESSSALSKVIEEMRCQEQASKASATALSVQLQVEIAARKDAESAQAEALERSRTLEAEIAQLRERLSTVEAERDGAVRQSAAATRSLDECEFRSLEAAAKAEAYSHRLAQAESALARATQTKRDTEDQEQETVRGLRAQLARFELELCESRRHITALTRALDGREGELEAASSEVKTLKAHKEWSTSEILKHRRAAEQASRAAQKAAEHESLFKAFLLRHDRDIDASGVSSAAALESLSAEIFRDAKLTASLASRLAEETAKVAFLELEAQALQASGTQSSPDGRATVAAVKSPAAETAPPKPMLLTPKERRQLNANHHFYYSH